MVASECPLKKSNDSQEFAGVRSLYYQHLAESFTEIMESKVVGSIPKVGVAFSDVSR